MKLARIRKRLHRNSEKQATTKEILQQIEQKIDLLDYTKINEDKINKTNQERIKNIYLQIQDAALSENIAFWQMYFLNWAVKSESYSLMRYVSFQVQIYPKLPHSKKFNRTRKIFNFARNRTNWKRIKNIKSKYRAFLKWSHEPESAWLLLALALGLCFYFIITEDFVPDLIPIIGFIDDFIAVIFVIIWFAAELNQNIVKLSESEARKYFFIVKLIFSFGIAGVVSAVATKFLMQIWEFLYSFS
jgi:uncharacterized membrane protein YkvA (DUF1232 family)